MCHKKNSEQFMVVFKTDSNVYQSLFDNIFKKKKNVKSYERLFKNKVLFDFLCVLLFSL